MAYTRIYFRRDTAAQWASENPVLGPGEMGLVIDSIGQETVFFKLGDGSTPWNDLPLASGPKGAKGDKGDTPPLSDSLISEDSNVAASSRAVKLAYERAVPRGDIRLWPFRPAELPPGWYIANGDRFPLNYPQAVVLSSLSDNYKADWGVAVADSKINLPNLFYIDGRGFFLRAVDGTARQVGSRRDDTGRNATGSFGAIWTGAGERPIQGVFGYEMAQIGAITMGQARSEIIFSLDLSRQWGAHAGAEFAPLNIGMTPAIYLGV